MAISPQRFTIYLYSAHRSVVFAIAQLYCSIYYVLYTVFYILVNREMLCGGVVFVFVCSVCNKWFHERGQEFIRSCDTVADN